MVTIQETSGKRIGGWSENWPDPGQKAWYGTTTDQLISMAGTYPIFKTYLTIKITLVEKSQRFRIVEPVVKDPGTTFQLTNDSTLIIKAASSNAEWCRDKACLVSTCVTLDYN